MRKINQSLKEKKIGIFDWFELEEKLRVTIINSIIDEEVSMYIAQKLGNLRTKYRNKAGISPRTEIIYLISKRGF